MKKLVLLFAIFLVFACDENPVADDAFSSFDRKGMLRNIGENLIIPSFEDFSLQSGEFESSVTAFISNPDNAGLANIQAEWKSMAEAWKRAEVFKIGPLSEEEGNIAIETIDYGSMYTMQIENAVDRNGIESFLSSNTTINAGTIDNLPPNQKGLFALEYLLFNREQGNTVVLDKFTSALNAERRREFLRHLSQNISSKADAIVNEWKPSGGNYIAKFINADGRDIGSSLGKLINRTIFFTEVVRGEKIGRPLGQRTNGNIQPQAAESRESNNSINFIRQNIKAIESTFLGRGANGDGRGLDDLLMHLNAQYEGQPLAEVIKNQFEKINTSLDQITIPLDQAITSNPAAVQQLFNDVKELVILMKVDMVNNVGVVITYQDNDGD